MNIKQQFLTPNKFSRPGLRLRAVKGIAVHYTGDPGATAQQTRDYFNSLARRQDRYASAHYVIGLQGGVIQMIPENEWSYCTNQANSYTISIETCHPDCTGKFTEATEQALIELVADLCKRYGLTAANVIRHYDVTRKCCPKYYVEHPEVWAAFKQAVADRMAGKPYTLPSYGKVIGYSPAVSDTTAPFTVKQGGTYQFKITSDTQPSLIPGSSGFRLVAQSHCGRAWYFKFQAVGKAGTGVGFYLNGCKTPVAVATIK